MKHQRSPLGYLPSLGMIRLIDDMMIEGERLLEEAQLKKDTLTENDRQKKKMLDKYVQKSNSNHTIRLEEVEPNWINASAATGEMYLGQINTYAFHTRSLKNMFPHQELSKHMLMTVSLTKKRGCKKFDFRYDAQSCGGNVFYSSDEIELCFGQGYELFIDLLNLQHDKPKTAWIGISENKNISNYL